MASIYYPSSASVYIRTVTTTNLNEFHIDTFPDVIFVFNPNTTFPYTSSVVFIQTMDTGSNFPITASWAQNGINSSSYALTSSFALNGGGGGGGAGDFIGNQVFS